MSDAPQVQSIDVNGVKVSYRRAGSGPPLLFLHGMGLTRNWLPLHARLAEDHDVLAPHHPGFGNTERPAWYRTLDDFVVHYADFLAALDLSTVGLVGHSLGGLLAGAFAATYPERLTSLTLIAPMPMPVITPPELLEHPDGPPPPNLGAILFNDDEQHYAEYLPDLVDMGDLVAEPDDAFGDPAAFRLDLAPGLYRRLSRVRVPAQVIVPDEDRAFPESGFEDWGKWLGAPVVRVAGGRAPTGHLLVVQEPESIADEIGRLR